MGEPDADGTHGPKRPPLKGSPAADASGAVCTAFPDAKRFMTLTAGVLAHIQSVVGDGAAEALLRYAASEEGKRLVQEAGASRFDTALAAFDHLLGHESSGTTTAEGSVEIRLRHCPFIREDRRALDLLLVGLLEGMLQAVLHVWYKGEIVGRQAEGDAVLRFEPDPANG